MKDILFSGRITVTDSIYITIICMFLVFFILTLLSFLLSLLKFLYKEEKNIEKDLKNKVETKETKKLNPEDVTDENMKVALMVAAMECANEDENAYVRVKSIRQII